jgi:hypothetical protein
VLRSENLCRRTLLPGPRPVRQSWVALGADRQRSRAGMQAHRGLTVATGMPPQEGIVRAFSPRPSLGHENAPSTRSFCSAGILRGATGRPPVQRQFFGGAQCGIGGEHHDGGCSCLLAHQIISTTATAPPTGRLLSRQLMTPVDTGLVLANHHSGVHRSETVGPADRRARTLGRFRRARHQSRDREGREPAELKRRVTLDIDGSVHG